MITLDEADRGPEENEPVAGLTSFRSVAEQDIDFLYLLLGERQDYQNISHKKMPSHKDHTIFVSQYINKTERNPYLYWAVIIDVNEERLGAFYLTKNNEIGIQIKEKYTGQGYGQYALNTIETIAYDMGHRTVLANINPSNDRSKKFFSGNSYKVLQLTYSKTITARVAT